MNIETQEQRDERQRDRKFRFDGTITLGNVITLIGMFGTILALWRNMEQRVLIVEERQAVQARTVEKLLDSVERLALVQAALNRNEKGN
jgi:muramoyltetrapeptide carboxypeptidase LdcA involved in peptidoglycan recycling